MILGTITVVILMITAAMLMKIYEYKNDYTEPMDEYDEDDN